MKNRNSKIPTFDKKTHFLDNDIIVFRHPGKMHIGPANSTMANCGWWTKHSLAAQALAAGKGQSDKYIKRQIELIGCKKCFRHISPKRIQMLIDNTREVFAGNGYGTVRAKTERTGYFVKKAKAETVDKTKVAQPVKKGACAMVRNVCEKHPNDSRKQILDRCAVRGINRATASTQYQKWRKEQAA